MKTAILIALFVFATADPIDYYVVDNTGLDVEASLASPLSLSSYIDCFLDKGPCNNVGASYKKNIVEAVAQACRRCSPEQKQLFWRFLEAIRPIFPTEYREFWTKYDPEHRYFGPLMDELYNFKNNIPFSLPITTDAPTTQFSLPITTDAPTTQFDFNVY